MTYDALTISRYIIKYSDEKCFNISNLKLQKLLYFIQCYFLMKKADICFTDDIEAWNLGPVIPSVYREYKKFGAGNIPLAYVQNKIVNDTSIEERDRVFIEDVICKLSGFSAVDLVDITHKQSPWKNTYSRNCNNVIQIESIKEYFC